MLAVFTYDLGASFIDKHIADVMSGQTVAVGSYGHHKKLAEMWPVDCPTLLLDRWKLGWQYRIGKRIGFDGNKLTANQVRRFLRQHNVKVVLGEYLDQFLEFTPILDEMNIPYVVQGHGIDVSAAVRETGMAKRYCNTYKNARAILTRCEFHRQRLIDLGLPADSTHVNFGGVNVPQETIVRENSATKHLLAIGLMVPKKAPIYLLEAFRIAVKKDPELTLDYIGEGPLYSAAQQFVRACGLTECVRLHGFAPESTKQELLRKCGVFVQHSLTTDDGNEEGLPAAIQEAMANGQAVVSTRHSGIPEAVVDHSTGILVDEGDVRGMAEAFINVQPNAADYGQAGHKEALDKHAWRHERDRLQSFLKIV